MKVLASLLYTRDLPSIGTNTDPLRKLRRTSSGLQILFGFESHPTMYVHTVPTCDSCKRRSVPMPISKTKCQQKNDTHRTLQQHTTTNHRQLVNKTGKSAFLPLPPCCATAPPTLRRSTLTPQGGHGLHVPCTKDASSPSPTPVYVRQTQSRDAKKIQDTKCEGVIL